MTGSLFGPFLQPVDPVDAGENQHPSQTDPFKPHVSPPPVSSPLVVGDRGFVHADCAVRRSRPSLHRSVHKVQSSHTTKQIASRTSLHAFVPTLARTPFRPSELPRRCTRPIVVGHWDPVQQRRHGRAPPRSRLKCRASVPLWQIIFPSWNLFSFLRKTEASFFECGNSYAATREWSSGLLEPGRGVGTVA
jgi:hypothetical protein